MRLPRASRPVLERALRDVAPAGTSAGSACLVIDADRTLAPQDTGRLVGRALGVDQRIRQVFETRGYEAESFARVTEIWGSIAPRMYLAAVDAAVDMVSPHALWLEIIAALRGRAPIVVVTAGIPQAWTSVLRRSGHDDIPVVGGCHPELDGYFVCRETKAEIVRLLRTRGLRVIAAGDSLIDLPMLRHADIPVFVPDAKGSPALLEQRHTIPGLRHLTVDARRFDGIPPCSAQELIHFTLEGTPRCSST